MEIVSKICILFNTVYKVIIPKDNYVAEKMMALKKNLYIIAKTTYILDFTIDISGL